MLAWRVLRDQVAWGGNQTRLACVEMEADGVRWREMAGDSGRWKQMAGDGGRWREREGDRGR
eukprot:scaffold46616_cov33-Phaeocystis_antarctica.AAC.1